MKGASQTDDFQVRRVTARERGYMWGSSWQLAVLFGKPPHQASNDRVLPSYFSTAGVGLVNKLTVHYDSPQFQTLDTSFRHGMLSPGQSQAAGREMVDAFVRDQMARARLLRMQGRQDESLDAFTAALHTLQDLTSLSHATRDGLLITWNGTGGPVNNTMALLHVAGELRDPGAGSELDGATRFAADWLTAGQVPRGNVVDALMTALGRSTATANETFPPLGETIILDKFVVTGVRGAGPPSNSGFGPNTLDSSTSSAESSSGSRVLIINIITPASPFTPHLRTADDIFFSEFRGGAPGSVRERAEAMAANKSWEQEQYEMFQQWTGEGRRLK